MSKKEKLELKEIRKIANQICDVLNNNSADAIVGIKTLAAVLAETMHSNDITHIEAILKCKEHKRHGVTIQFDAPKK